MEVKKQGNLGTFQIRNGQLFFIKNEGVESMKGQLRATDRPSQFLTMAVMVLCGVSVLLHPFLGIVVGGLGLAIMIRRKV